ncbi:hypothetical protein GKC30_14095 [Pseudodesulfovibrio sp. F-1]|uniref:Uncharacterized protein n=1 Tax=Pseudodesulfovibrio alkaliphilus TaxID=2661613 RepID=A0A7K1KRN5_9BACT|nr:hypothetical protein [Pseudodesulfovibrio alkaliphilus]MUM78766.1 hypothetical protein [Pseudodesulfovibrio alkaliphilus]
MLTVYFNFVAFAFVALSFALSLLLHLKKTERMKKATNLTFMLVFSTTMLCLVYTLTDLSNLDTLGKLLSFILLSNAYAGTLKTTELIFSGIKK